MYILLTKAKLQPSKKVFNDMIHEIEIGRENQDGADQGFIGGHFPDLLDQPMFHPLNGTKLQGTYRLPLGYQMDASYYCKFETLSVLTEQSLSYFMTSYNDCLLLIV